MSELNVQEYIDALGGVGEKAYEWQDKPHRLVYDLVAEIIRLREIINEGEKK